MYIDFDKALGSTLERHWDLPLYQKIMEQVRIVDVSADADFQRTFNYFYQVRRDESWRKEYYVLFEKMKHAQDISFPAIITELYHSTGKLEASFSSKMLATLDPSEPIWDSRVCTLLDLKVTGKTKEEELQNIIALYSRLENWYVEFLQTDNAKECIAKFDKLLPKYTWLSGTKKIDYLLWSIIE